MAPWADVLYAGDLRWWRVYGAEAERDFRGERWSCAGLDGVNHVEGVDDVGLSLRPGRIHTGGNSGYQAIGLAFMFGASRIVLLGYDLQRGPKGESHHHGDHGHGLPNLTSDMREWVRRFLTLGADLRRQGVEVINATRRTALKCFEPQPLDIALAARRARTAALLIPRELLPLEHEAFSKGLAAAGYRIAGPAERADTSIVWGGRDNPDGAKLIAENGYLDGSDGPYVALALGGHNGAGRTPAGGAARLARLNVNLKPWRTRGEHVLVCPSRGLKTSAMPQPAGWTERTVAELQRLTDRPIRVREHPGNWKVNPPAVPLEDDLRGAHACVIWGSTAGVRALAEGVPVIYTAPHWICAEAASNRLEDIESPPMPDRTPAFERLASAQWSLDEIASGAPFRALLGELTVLCVLKSGGDYDAEYVRKLRDSVARHLTIPHRFVCLSDVPVPCERIPLKHGWKGWWSKIEVFRPDVVTGPTLYLDLDTIVVDDLDRVAAIPYEFAMLNIREKDTKVGNSGAMWLTKPFPHVYERFAEKPDYWIDYHERNAKDRYMGDQAFISDCFPAIPKLHHALPGFFRSYKYDRCQEEIPAGCAVVCFGGPPRPAQAGGWVKQAWV
jgi:hypothetical protein